MNSILSNCLRKTCIAVGVVFLTACATPSFIPQADDGIHTPINLDKMYVRGIFNWWEAEPAYLLKKDDKGYSINLELIADGQPYDFRLSDEYWSPSNSCGATQIKPIGENQTTELYCGGNSKNLQFTPNVTGVYKITVLQQKTGLALVVTRY